MSKKRPSIGKVTAAVIAIVIIVIAGGAGYYYYLSTIPKPVSMTIMVDSGSETQQYLSVVAKDFEATHPYVTINIEGVGFSDMVTTASTALKDKASQPAIIMFYPSQAPDLAPYLANLQDYSSEINLSNMIYAEMQQGGYYYAPNGTVISTIGVPIHSVFGYVLGYQKSIFENTTLASEFQKQYGFAFNPTNLTTWTQLYDIASFINSSHVTQYALLFPDSSHHADIDMVMPLLEYYGLKDNVQGFVSEPPGYYTLLMNINGRWTTSFNTTAGVDSLMMWNQLIKFEPSLSVQAIGYDQQEQFPETGQYAMFIMWTSFIPDYLANTSKIAGNLGIALLPGKMTGFSPTFLGINPYGPNPKLAAEFIAFAMSNAEYEKGIESIGYVPGTYTGIQMASQNANLSWLGPFYTFALTSKVPVLEAAAIPVIGSLTGTLIPYFNSEVYSFMTSSHPTPALAQQNLQKAANEWMSYIQSQHITL
ncbi:MAG: extracellular solute-binding protein [Conexivisphaerales archaeon]